MKYNGKYFTVYSWKDYMCTEVSSFRHSGIPLSLLLIFVFFGMQEVAARESLHHEVTASADDYALREAMLTDNIIEFNSYLSLGANPLEWLDNSQQGWVFCAVTEKGREEYLRILIDRGFDVNFQQVDISTSISSPLTCAVRYGNILALEMLIDAGADPAMEIAGRVVNRIPMSVLSQAIIVGKYELAEWLFDKGNYSEEQLLSDISILEKFPVNESASGNYFRLGLADKFREKGYQVTPWTREEAEAK